MYIYIHLYSAQKNTRDTKNKPCFLEIYQMTCTPRAKKPDYKRFEHSTWFTYMLPAVTHTHTQSTQKPNIWFIINHSQAGVWVARCMCRWMYRMWWCTLYIWTICVKCNCNNAHIWNEALRRANRRSCNDVLALCPAQRPQIHPECRHIYIYTTIHTHTLSKGASPLYKAAIPCAHTHSRSHGANQQQICVFLFGLGLEDERVCVL